MKTPFKGKKLSEITITKLQAEDLLAGGRSVVCVGTWDDGTPAFCGLTLQPDAPSDRYPPKET